MELSIHGVKAEVTCSNYANARCVTLRLTDYREQQIELNLWPADDALWVQLMALPKAPDYRDDDAADGRETPLTNRASAEAA